MLTQVIVAEDDPAFQDPSKPIGVVYTESQAQELTQRGFRIRRDAHRGYRRVVPSPTPLQILELEVIQNLFLNGTLVIAAGGGGIPVVRVAGQLHGVEAVIDKDLTAAMLADKLDAELLLILTDVPCAFTGYGTPKQQPIGRISNVEGRRLITDGHFAAGSMKPKMEAAVRFADRPGRQVIICNPDSLPAALSGKSGTCVVAAQMDTETNSSGIGIDESKT